MIILSENDNSEAELQHDNQICLKMLIRLSWMMTFISMRLVYIKKLIFFVNRFSIQHLFYYFSQYLIINYYIELFLLLNLRFNLLVYTSFSTHFCWSQLKKLLISLYFNFLFFFLSLSSLLLIFHDLFNWDQSLKIIAENAVLHFLEDLY